MSDKNKAPFTLAERLKKGEVCFGAWLGIPEPVVADALARENFDVMIFDMQHSAQDFTSIRNGITATHHAGKPSAVRLALDDFGHGAKLLDMGAELIIAPMINSAADARKFAAAVKYAPLGERSWGGSRMLHLSGLDAQSYLKQANSKTVALAMIETKMAFAAVDEILAVPGIDGVFIGPSDLSISLLDGAKVDALHPVVAEAMEKVMAAAKRAGKIAGCYAATPESAADSAKKGWTLISVAGDGGILKAGAQAVLAKVGR